MKEKKKNKSNINFLFGVIAGIILYKLIFEVLIPMFS